MNVISRLNLDSITDSKFYGTVFAFFKQNFREVFDVDDVLVLEMSYDVYYAS